MENITDIEGQLRDAERAAAAPYLSYPKTAWWYAPGLALWAAAFVGAFLLLDGIVFAAVIAGLLAVEFTAIHLYRKRWGAWPKLSGAPAEIEDEYRRYWVCLVPLVAAIIAAGLLLPAAAAIALTFVLVGAGTLVYERRYERAAAEARARLR